jgi:TatD DNase family protein
LPLSPSIEDLPVVAAERETWTKAETNIETEKGVRAETCTDTDGGGEGPSTPLGEQYGLHMTVGVHPTRADLFLPSDDTNDGDGDVADGKRTGSKVLDAMLSIIVDANSSSSRKVVVAVGECGLDYARLQFCSKEKQLSGFLKQLQLAAHPLVDLPLFLHSRDTEGDFLRIMQDNYHLYARRGGVVHSFDGTVEEMLALCELGLYIGINGCSLRTDALLHTLVPAIPADRLLLETDAPWCGIKKTHPSYPFILSEIPVTGVKKKEKWEAGYVVKDRNEPMYIHQVAEVVARTRGVSVQELAEQCWINSQKLFFF